MSHSLRIIAICLIFLVSVLFSIVMEVSAAKEDRLEEDIVKMTKSLIQESTDKTAHLRKKLQQCKAMGQDITYPDAALAVAELFIQFSRHDIQEDELHESALRSMRYICEMLDVAILETDSVLAGNTTYPHIPDWNVIGLQIRDGGFWSGDEPVFLTGFNWDSAMAREKPELLKRLGVNLVDGMFWGSMLSMTEFSDRRFEERDRPYLEQMKRDNFAVDVMLASAPPRWMYDKYPNLKDPSAGHYTNYAIDHPALSEMRRRYIDHYAPMYGKQDALLSVDLFNEPAFLKPSKFSIVNWREWLKDRYGSIEVLNRTWGSSIESFESITHPPGTPDATLRLSNTWAQSPIEWDKPGVRGMHYDWCVFNKERVTGFFREYHDRIQANAPHLATHVKIMMGGYFTGSLEKRGWRMGVSYNRQGIDAQALNEMCTLLGCDMGMNDLSLVESLNAFYGSAPYIIGWVNPGLASDFLKSIAPDKPFYNSEWHPVEAVDETQIKHSPSEHMITALWLAHLHGMSANLLWYWGRKVDGSVGRGEQWFKNSLLQQPWLLQAYVQESLNLRRFVPQIMAFSQQSRPVRLLYSEPSAIQDVYYLDELRHAYEALNFLGVSIGFVTERQLARDGLPDDTHVVIVPNAKYTTNETVAALRAAIGNNIVVGVIGESLTMTPHGLPRENATVDGAYYIPVGSPQEYHPSFDQWITEAGIRREVLALDKEGKPAWGIEMRTAQVNGQQLVYFVNLMRDHVTVQLKWAEHAARLRDLRTGQEVPQTVEFAPRQLLFCQYGRKK
ncbi:beta-galactosidase [Candidatus Poribacteria bacterium]